MQHATRLDRPESEQSGPIATLGHISTTIAGSCFRRNSPLLRGVRWTERRCRSPPAPWRREARPYPGIARREKPHENKRMNSAPLTTTAQAAPPAAGASGRARPMVRLDGPQVSRKSIGPKARKPLRLVQTRDVCTDRATSRPGQNPERFGSAVQAFTSTTTRPLTCPFRMSRPSPGRSESVASCTIASSFSMGRSRAMRSQARRRSA